MNIKPLAFESMGTRGVEMLTAAEFAGLKNDLPETKRKRLCGR
jgi:predicted metallo-beta-lactamase superfamily hydrolase